MHRLTIKFLIFLLVLSNAPSSFSQTSTDWRSPEIACALLAKEINIKTGRYREHSPGEYICASPYRELGKGQPLANNIAYYVEGDRETAKELKLVLNVYVRESSQLAHDALALAGGVLTRRALGGQLPDEIFDALMLGKSGKWRVGKNRVEILREEWPSGRGYEIKFLIR